MLFRSSVAVERRLTRSFRLAGNLGFRLPFGDSAQLTSVAEANASPVSYGPSLTYGVGASYRLGTVVDLMAEVYGAQYVNGFGNALATTPMEAVGGAKIFVDRNSYLFLGGGAGVTPALASAGFRGFVGFIFEPTVGDTDGDGYRDDVDRCPVEPEDFDNFEDEEGCPEPDNDRDGILDVDDQCPLVPEDRNGQQDTDGCPDSDVADRDGDQIADNVDQCPDDPEDRDNFEDQNGCPDPDNDQDQILDTDDLCPNDPEDRDNFEDDNGCPDPDNDQDGILDGNDHSAGGQDCRNDPEVFNGLEDEDGCPDQGRIRVIGTVVDLDPILFETDSAQIVDNARATLAEDMTLDADRNAIRGSGQRWRIDVGPRASVDIGLVPSLSGDAAPRMTTWTSVAIVGRQARVRMLLESDSAWEPEGIDAASPAHFTLAKDPDIVVTAVRMHQPPPMAAEPRWIDEGGGAALRVEIPAACMGRRQAFIVEAVAPFATATMRPLPLLRLAEQAWGGGGIVIQVDPAQVISDLQLYQDEHHPLQYTC